MTHDKDDPWKRLTEAARQAPGSREHDRLDLEAPFGFSTRVVAAAQDEKLDRLRSGSLARWRKSALAAAAFAVGITVAFALVPAAPEGMEENVLTPMPTLDFPE